MKTHPDNAIILKHSCAVLESLSCHDDYKVAISAAGGIAVRFAALGPHLSDRSFRLHHTIQTTSYTANHDPNSYQFIYYHLIHITNPNRFHYFALPLSPNHHISNPLECICVPASLA